VQVESFLNGKYFTAVFIAVSSGTLDFSVDISTASELFFYAMGTT
jgi:hypothetical protein